MVCTLDRRNVCQTLYRLIGEYRKGTALCDPCIVVHSFLRHRLFDHDDSVFLKPEDFIQGLLAVLPSLVRIDCKRKIRDLADGADHFLVIVQSHLDLEDVELVRTFSGLLAHDIRCVDTYCKCGVRCLGRVQTPYPPPWLAHQFSYKIMQGNIYGSLGCIVSRRQTVHVCQYFLKTERILELTQINS